MKQNPFPLFYLGYLSLFPVLQLKIPIPLAHSTKHHFLCVSNYTENVFQELNFFYRALSTLTVNNYWYFIHIPWISVY